MKRVAIGLLLFFFSAGTPAYAQSSDAEARATKLFEEGRSLARQGRCADAVDLFQASLREATGVGPLLNLGNCYEQMGKPATAQRWFIRAAEVARERHDPRAAEATERARALEPRISDLTVRVATPDEADLELRLDGEPLDRARWNVAARVDPGTHVVEASSPRRHTSLRVVVGDGGQHAELVVPAPAPESSPSSTRPASAVATDEKSDGSTLRTLGWGAGAVGTGAIAVGAVFGVLSMIDHGKVVDRCPAYPTCPVTSRSEIDDTNSAARTKGTVATISIVAGAVLVAGGIVLLLTAPHER